LYSSHRNCDPFILNNEDISTSLSAGTTVLDFVRYHKNLKGHEDRMSRGRLRGVHDTRRRVEGTARVRYRSMTSCLMPLANASGKHIVTIEGVNPEDGSLTAVQQAMIDESGTQCGFCTVGFVMSLTGFCIRRHCKNARDGCLVDRWQHLPMHGI
jgi:xanthine dehydrogenase small subunit